MVDPFEKLLSRPPDLPVVGALDQVLRAATTHGAVVVDAPPGTGKTTLVPPALAATLEGVVVVTQPRRVAARAAARRLAALLGEPVGGSVGFTVRGESRRSARTRVEVVTTGVLVRRLQRDPELPGVAAVVLDEVHERHLEQDLATALVRDVRAHLRPDVVVVAMSATSQVDATAGVIGLEEPAPVVRVQARPHPLEVRWCPPPSGVVASDGRSGAFLDHVVGVARAALTGEQGDVLVFVPGAREVDHVVRRLRGGEVDVLPLHGRLDAAAQDRALAPGARRRVVVATTVAESSLTVPGVRVVVDSGLAREPRTDHRRGLQGLVTVSVSRAGAEQRAGRAARLGPGTVYRCWSQVDHARLPEQPSPQVSTADLTGVLLELAAWGAPRGRGLRLPGPLPDAAVEVAERTLRGIGAVDAAGAITPRGRRVLALGLDPR
ncbi:ATP-dependent helicase, partial [Cellulomonas bogoriensis 69B4 = DSM 16987]